MNRRIMIAGTGSGCGKTSIVCGLIMAFKNVGEDVTAFKCGPDYIDPIFHKSVLGIDSYNLDIFLSGEDGVKSLLSQKSRKSSISIIEGVMGFYDGIMGDNFECSSCHISNITGTNVVLVVDCKGKGASVAAQIKGYMDFYPNLIKGVILNRVSQAMFNYYKNIIEKYLDVIVVGYLPDNKDYILSKRKLGLCVDEMESVVKKVGLISDTLSSTIDFDAILKIADDCKAFLQIEVESYTRKNVRVAVAQDDAFCFGYSYNYEIMESMGAEIVFFSPLNDKKLPVNVNGIIIGGGFVTDYADMLSANKSMLSDISQKLKKGIPAILEGAGNILLCSKYYDEKMNLFKFSGYLDTIFTQSNKLKNFGYHFISAIEDNLICNKGSTIPVHEFHYFNIDNSGDSFEVYKPSRNVVRKCIFSTDNLYAGMPYIYFCGNESIAKRFIDKCLDYKKRRTCI